MNIRKHLTIVGASIVLLSLAACSSGVDTAPVLNKVDVEIAPLLSVSEDFLGWGGEKDFNPIAAAGLNYISFKNEAESCLFEAESAFTDSWKANRGENFNSFDLFYSQMKASVVDAETPEIGKIGDISYVIGEYINTENKHTKTAVRAFDSVFKIPGFENDNDLEGIYGSDPTKGIPYVSFTLQCDKPEDIDALWQGALDRVDVYLTEAPKTADESQIALGFDELAEGGTSTPPREVPEGYTEPGSPEDIGYEPEPGSEEITDPNDPAYEGPIEENNEPEGGFVE